MLNSLLNLFFPKICYACGNSINSQLNHICLKCRISIPRTNAHTEADNPIEKMFWGRLELKKATAFLLFEKGNKVQNLLHHLKYKGIKELGITLGELAAVELKESIFFNDIDLIVPIPIHPQKRRKRGYNQSEFIAKGVANITHKELSNNLVSKSFNTQSQTRKGRFKRWKNVKSTFQLSQDIDITNKHILLIDDVVTTGSTVEACGEVLLKVEGVKLSLLTIAAPY